MLLRIEHWLFSVYLSNYIWIDLHNAQCQQEHTYTNIRMEDYILRIVFSLPFIRQIIAQPPPCPHSQFPSSIHDTTAE